MTPLYIDKVSRLHVTCSDAKICYMVPLCIYFQEVGESVFFCKVLFLLQDCIHEYFFRHVMRKRPFRHVQTEKTKTSRPTCARTYILSYTLHGVNVTVSIILSKYVRWSESSQVIYAQREVFSRHASNQINRLNRAYMSLQCYKLVGFYNCLPQRLRVRTAT